MIPPPSRRPCPKFSFAPFSLLLRRSFSHLLFSSPLHNRPIYPLPLRQFPIEFTTCHFLFYLSHSRPCLHLLLAQHPVRSMSGALEKVVEAVRVLNHDTLSCNRVAANQWLVQFQHSHAAWEVATSLLTTSSLPLPPGYNLEAHFFAAQILRRKVF